MASHPPRRRRPRRDPLRRPRRRRGDAHRAPRPTAPGDRLDARARADPRQHGVDRPDRRRVQRRGARVLPGVRQRSSRLGGDGAVALRRPPRLPARRAARGVADVGRPSRVGLAGPAVPDRAVPPDDRHRRRRGATRRRALLDRPGRVDRHQRGGDGRDHPRRCRRRRPVQQSDQWWPVHRRRQDRQFTDAGVETGRCADIDHRLHQARIGASHEQGRSRRLAGRGSRCRAVPDVGRVPGEERHLHLRRQQRHGRPRPRPVVLVTAYATSRTGWRGPR